MSDFLTTVLTFPTLIYSVLFAFTLVYWLLCLTGLVEIDLVDGFLGGEGEHGDASTLSAMLGRFGLAGVPLMVVLTVLSFVGWLITYFTQLLLLAHLPDGLRLVAGIGVLVLALLPGMLLTSLLLRPLSKLLLRLRPPTTRSVLGMVGEVISPTVDAQRGQARFNDGGAGLVFQVRARSPDSFVRGQRVALIEYDAKTHVYRVIAEDAFNR